MQKKIVITGGPGTGKSTVIIELEKQNYQCMHEISREVTLMARKNGIEQLFLKDPMLFSKMLLEGRVNQFKKASNLKNNIVFFDRGIPDVFAYMNYLGVEYPSIFIDQCNNNQYYNTIFLMPPWKDIYITDNERYESFEQSLAIYNHLKSAYKGLGYTIIEVPFGTAQERAGFILKKIQ
ncbi:MAG TPA: ATPase [Flavobacteriaceae bacterium]|nr:ATPase [Flavobacteriaceae bacterium]HIP27018.1 ATPase [Flavobacteriaceae bacterium]